MNDQPTIIDWNERCRARYLDPSLARASVMSRETQHAQLERASYMLRIAKDPQGRFDLRDTDIPSSVVSELEALHGELLAEIMPKVCKLAARHAKLEAEGFAQDEIWSELHEQSAPLGYGYGDSSILRAIHKNS